MTTDEPQPKCTGIELFVGTYDNYLFSYRVVEQLAQQPNSPTTHAFQRLIAQSPHTASVRCLTACGRYLATGGADDRIAIVDLRTNQEVQLLTHHTGTINRVAFTPDGSHLFSVADDGTMAATKTGSWLTDNVWRTPHSGRPITALAVHPSGKLALTVGRDGTLRTWSLIKGRQCFTTNLRTLCTRGDTIESVWWSPRGERFALIAVDRVLVMSVGEAAVEREFVGAGKRRTTALCWLDEERLVLGQESGCVRFVRVAGEEEEEEKEDEKTTEVRVHENRVKDMALMHGHLVTISCTSSAGSVALWRLDADACRVEQVCETSLGRRPICLAVADATVYRKEVKAETTAETTAAAAARKLAQSADEARPVAAVRRIVSTGRVTIETGDDDEAGDEATVSVLQTPKTSSSKKSKKRKLVAEVEDDGAEELEELDSTPPARSNKKNKKKKVTETPELIAEVTGKVKKNKRKSAEFAESDVLTETTTTTTTPKKKSKKSRALNKSATVVAEDVTPARPQGAKDRRKSSKW